MPRTAKRQSIFLMIIIYRANIINFSYLTKGLPTIMSWLASFCEELGKRNRFLQLMVHKHKADDDAQR